MRMFLRVLLLISLVAVGFSTQNEIHSSFANSLVLISTLDGVLRAVDLKDGVEKWTLREGPVLRTPTEVKRGFTYLPNPQDGSLYVLKDGILKKLGLTIPELVYTSPLQGSDGVLYTGHKKDVWFGIDPNTGRKLETLTSSSESVCPVNPGKKSVFIGRTEYRVSMFDINNRGKSWNATFNDYSAHVLPTDSSYPLRHYVSSSSGRVLAVDNESGQIAWESDLGMPVVAMYLLQDDGLHKLSYTTLGKETFDSLVKSAFSTFYKGSVDGASSQGLLYPTLYVGETAFGLYAISSLVDEHTITYAPKYLGPRLLEGPSPIAIAADDKAQFVPSQRPVVTINPMGSATHKKGEYEFLLLGYHEPPQDHPGPINRMRFTKFPTFPTIGVSKELPALPPAVDESLRGMIYEIYLKHPNSAYAFIATVFALVIAAVWACGRQSGVDLVVGEARSAQTSRVSTSSKSWIFSKNNDVPDGWFNVGKVLYNPNDVLGRGCEGTVVYRGKFDGREVAVKRVVSEFLRLVDREADLLRESDFHPHVIRYYCMESDSQFRYLALELCAASLYDYVENKEIRQKIGIDQIKILKQATEGLAHLHEMNMVHRDLKPQNVLLSISAQREQVRVVISDFGLCKRIQPGRHSLSRRSGMAGTDGWIAPEVLQMESSGRPVDIFSLGCIFYYILSDGSHPFGDNFHRQANIVNGKYHLKDIKEDVNVASILIEAMVQLAATDRPTASAVLCHPMFWSAERRLGFFGDVSDRIEKEEESSPVVRRLEKNARVVVNGGWRNHICKPLTDDLRKFRTYKSHCVRDLLRAMRNKKHHYRELPAEVRESLGQIPEQFLEYWTSRFPMLLMHVYEAMEWCAGETVFRGYYSDEVRLRMSDIIAQEEQDRREAQDNMNSAQWVRGQTPEKKAKPALS